MKNNIFKFIALSMLPLSLMSFKGNLGGIDSSYLAIKKAQENGEKELFAYSGSFANGNYSRRPVGPSTWEHEFSFNPPNSLYDRFVPGGRNILKIPMFYIEESVEKTLGGSLVFNVESDIYGNHKIPILSYGLSSESNDNNDNFASYLGKRYSFADGVYDHSVLIDKFAAIDLNSLLSSKIKDFDFRRVYSGSFSSGLSLVLHSPGDELAGVYFGGLGEKQNWVDFSPRFPVIEGGFRDGQTKDVYVNVDTPSSFDQIKAGISAYDLFGADVPVEYSVKEGSKEYDPNNIGIS